jgi:proteasome lid subunit RPN8/RPN11
MLRIDASTMAEVGAHAAEAYPHECCGLLLGDARHARRAFRTKNLDTERAKDRYLMDPSDRLAAEDAARAAGLGVVGFYHSHPDHDAYFSRTDLERSEEFQWGEPWVPPTYAYLVVSVREGSVRSWKAFEVRDGGAHEVPVQVD